MSDSNSDAIPIPRQGFVLEELDGETLLYRHSLKKLIYLNASAALVWKLCDGKRSAREIAGILADAYPEEADMVTTDVSDALDGLVREGALRTADQPGESTIPLHRKSLQDPSVERSCFRFAMISLPLGSPISSRKWASISSDGKPSPRKPTR